MKIIAKIFLFCLSICWSLVGYNYLTNLIPNTVIYQYNNYSILIILSGMFVFGILFGKLISENKEKINHTTDVEKDLFIPEIVDVEKITYKNYPDDSEITKNSIDIILEDREKDITHKINLENQVSKNDNNKVIKEDRMFLNVANKLARMKKQDLKIIEGIGPKIENILNDNGIYSYKDLANSELIKLQNILLKAGKRYLILHNPITWSKQAEIAIKGDMELLEQYQSKLVKGVEK